MVKIEDSSLKRITIPERIWYQVCTHTQEVLPEEACGLLAGKDGGVCKIITVPNMLHSPVKYRMDPALQLKAFLQLEADGLELVAIFHSHPSGPDRPSQTDIVEAYYPDSAYIIVYPYKDGWKARGFLISLQTAKEIPLMIIEDI